MHISNTENRPKRSVVEETDPYLTVGALVLFISDQESIKLEKMQSGALFAEANLLDENGD